MLFSQIIITDRKKNSNDSADFEKRLTIFKDIKKVFILFL